MEELENILPENNNPQESELTPEIDVPVAEIPEDPQPEIVEAVAEEIPAEVPHQEAAPAPEAEPAAQASPYANSPYVSYYDGTGHPTQKKKPKKAKKGFGKKLICVLVVLALLAGSCCATAVYVNNQWNDRLEDTTEALHKHIMDLETKIAGITAGGTGTVAPTTGMTPGQVYAQNVDAVVAISCEVTTQGFFGYSTGVSSGSGFLISDDGYVLTNAHVVEGAHSIEVATHAEQTYPAQLIGADSINDVALLKIEASGMPYVTIGSSSSVVVGDQVAAIGNPLGTLTSTMTVGYVSAKDRIVTTDGSAINMLQTDAAINSGNSGGPLFNMKGEVIGITTAKYSGTSSSGATIEGIGFAIPVDDIQGILGELKDQGYVSSAYLGITVEDVPETAQNYGVPAGAFIREIVDGYAAQKAGLKPNDIIVELGDIDIGSTNDLLLALRKFQPGETTEITVHRSGMEMEFDITLDERPQEQQ